MKKNKTMEDLFAKVPFCDDIGGTYGAVPANGYSCPKCGEYGKDDMDGYDVDGEHYPKYFNEYKGSTMDGNYHNWDELHCCEECKIKFWFENGAY